MGKEYKQAIYSKYSCSINIEKVPTCTRSKNSQITVANYVSDWQNETDLYTSVSKVIGKGVEGNWLLLLSKLIWYYLLKCICVYICMYICICVHTFYTLISLQAAHPSHRGSHRYTDVYFNIFLPLIL